MKGNRALTLAAILAAMNAGEYRPDRVPPDLPSYGTPSNRRHRRSAYGSNAATTGSSKSAKAKKQKRKAVKAARKRNRS